MLLENLLNLLQSSIGFDYYVTFLDDFSRESWIYLLKNKT
jgi:hypothetical protein